MQKQVTFYMAENVFQLFKQKYPNVTSVFLRRCIIKALESSEFFQDVFFNTKDVYKEN